MVYNFFDKETSGDAVENEDMTNEELAEELHNQLLKKLKNEKYTHLL